MGLFKLIGVPCLQTVQYTKQSPMGAVGFDCKDGGGMGGGCCEDVYGREYMFLDGLKPSVRGRLSSVYNRGGFGWEKASRDFPFIWRSMLATCISRETSDATCQNHEEVKQGVDLVESFEGSFGTSLTASFPESLVEVLEVSVDNSAGTDSDSFGGSVAAFSIGGSTSDCFEERSPPLAADMGGNCVLGAVVERGG